MFKFFVIQIIGKNVLDRKNYINSFNQWFLPIFHTYILEMFIICIILFLVIFLHYYKYTAKIIFLVIYDIDSEISKLK